METEQRFNFRQERDFGESLDFLGKFISKFFMRVFKKSIASAIKYFFMSLAIMVVGFGAMAATVGVNIDAFTSSNEPPVAIISIAVILGLTAIILSIMFSLTYLTSVINYVKQYVEGRSHEEINVREGMEGMNSRVFWGGVATFFTVLLGAMFCYIPGIYFAIAYSLVPSLIVIENLSVGEAMSRSRKLIKENWWFSFGLMFISGFIVAIIGGIVQFPLQIMTQLIPAFGGDDPVVMGILLGAIFLIAMPIIIFVRLSLQMVPMIVNAFNYYRLVEEKEGVGAIEDANAWDEPEVTDKPSIQ